MISELHIKSNATFFDITNDNFDIIFDNEFDVREFVINDIRNSEMIKNGIDMLIFYFPVSENNYEIINWCIID
jgi:hypothetical protein